MSLKLWRILFAFTLISTLGLTAKAADPDNPKTPGDATKRAETDDATKRRDAMREFYETPVTPQFLRYMNGAAARERARNGALLPKVVQGGTAANPTLTITSAVTGSNWVNLGPTRADYIENGSSHLEKTDSGRAAEVIPHPLNANVLYVAMAGGGVWKTIDDGANWTPITESLGSLSIGGLALVPNANTALDVLYLGLGDAFDGTGIGFTKSADGGATWAPIQTLGNSTRTTEIKVAASNSNVVLVTTDKGLFRSTNAGASFTSVSLGTLERQCAWSIAQGAGNRIAVSMGSCSVDFGLEDTTSGQIWYSDDNGATWSQSAGVAAASGVGRITVASSPANRNVMYAAAAIPGSVSADDLADFFRSSDGGATWTAMGASARRVAYTNRNRESAGPRTLFNGQGWYDQLVLPSQTDQNVVYVGGALLLVRIDNALSATPTYTQVTNWLAQFGLPYVHADFHAGATTADGRIYVGNDGGVFMSSDNGATWTDRYNVGITSHLLYALGSTEAPGAENEIIGGFQDNGTRVRAGATSTYNQEIGGDGFGANIHPLNGNLMLGSLYNTRIYKSTDGGLNFSAATTGIREAGTGSAPFLTRIVPYLGDATGNTLFTHVNLKVYKSTNYAGKWSALGTTGFITSGSIRNIGVKVNDSNYVGAVASGGRVWVTTNGGTSWTQTTNATDNALSMNSIWFDVANPTTIFVSSVAPDGNAPHLWKSADLGQTWTKLGDCDGATGTGLDCGLPVNTVYGDPTDANVLYLGTHLGVYKSSDGGSHWSRFGSGMPLVNIMDFYISPSGKMRAASYGRGFWQLN